MYNFFLPPAAAGAYLSLSCPSVVYCFCSPSQKSSWSIEGKEERSQQSVCVCVCTANSAYTRTPLLPSIRVRPTLSSSSSSSSYLKGNYIFSFFLSLLRRGDSNKRREKEPMATPPLLLFIPFIIMGIMTAHMRDSLRIRSATGGIRKMKEE